MTISRKILQFYHKVIRSESRESCADKKLDHSPIVTYFKEGKTIALHRDLDITDEMAELDGVSSSSADDETKTWLGNKWFENFLAVWVVDGLPSGTPLIEIKKRYQKEIERDISYSDLSTLLNQRDLFNGHIGNPSQSFFHYVGAIRHHGSEDKSRELESVLSDFLRSRKHHKTLMGDFNADQQGASEESHGDEISHITPVQSSTRGEQEGNCTTIMSFDITESDWQYTHALKEKGDQESVDPKYGEARKRGYPPLWVVTVRYGNITEAGEAKSKREAKHLASKKAWYKLGGGEI